MRATPEIRAEAVAAYAEGATAKEIGDRLGFSKNAVTAWLHQAGVNVRAGAPRRRRPDCHIDGCTQPSYTSGWCIEHYEAFRPAKRSRADESEHIYHGGWENVGGVMRPLVPEPRSDNHKESA